MIRSTAPGRTRLALLIVPAILPWSWFVVRDSGRVLDVLATVLPLPVALVAITCLAIAAWRRRPLWVIVGVSWAAGTVAVVGPWSSLSGPAPVHPIRVVMANVDTFNASLAQATTNILAEDGDLVVLVESKPQIEPSFQAAYPFFVRTPNSDGLVYSRYPVRMLAALPSIADWLQLSGPSGRVTLFTAHPTRPAFGNP